MRTMKSILLTLGLVGTLASCGAPAYADGQCGDAKKMVAAVTQQGQAPVGGGMVSGNVIVVVYANSDGSRWTIVSLATDGSACMLLAGGGWFGALPELPAPGERGA